MTNHKKLTIVHIASEVDPFSKTGGLADVTRSLPKAQKRLGHDVCVITPLYEQVIDKKKHGLALIEKNITIMLNDRDTARVSFYRGGLMHGLPVYFVENKKYFSQKKSLYGSGRENARFLVFNVAALRLMSMRNMRPDIIHCHDWQTGLIPYFIKTGFHYTQQLSGAKTLFTIHNLAFQMGMNWWEVPLEHKDYGKNKLPDINDDAVNYINFVKRAILNADAINAVSENYATEILTKRFGQDLQRILQNRQHKLFGIQNGIDYRDYNPATDAGLKKNYTAKHLGTKKINKAFVQKKFGLPVNTDRPLVAMTSRLVFQKGVALVLKIAKPLMRLNAQFIFIGAGDKTYITKLQRLARQYPDRVAVAPSHEQNQKYETLVYAASDLLLLPSHHEPCGLNQMIAMRYGCVPVVHKVGGLFDTVENYHTAADSGTGFVFDSFDTYQLYGALVRALELYQHQRRWKQLVIRDMRQSNSWEIPAKKYTNLYRDMLNGASA